MRIQYSPADEKPEGHIEYTNVGGFAVGQAVTLSAKQEAQGKKLVDNGDFTEVDANDKPVKAAKKADDEPAAPAKKKAPAKRK